jgi:glutathione S-transferase
MIKLYYMPPSGNSYKVRILLSLLEVPHEKILVSGHAREHKTPQFLAMNPRGEVPVMDIDGVYLWDSAACLVYLAHQFGGDTWLPADPLQMAQVMQWVALAGNEIQFGLQYARRGMLQDRWTAGTLEQGHAISRIALNALEGRLKNNDWLALGRTTIADIACFPYVETAPQAKIALEDYPAILKWIARCKALPNWAER